MPINKENGQLGYNNFEPGYIWKGESSVGSTGKVELLNLWYFIQHNFFLTDYSEKKWAEEEKSCVFL